VTGTAGPVANRWTPLRVPGEVELAVGRTGHGPDPVVAVHGITSQHRAFNAVARHLRHPDGMAAVDLRGRGDSGKPPSGYGFKTHASDLLRVLDHLGIERAVLAGHSMGAFVVEEVALAAPERVRALVLLDGGWPRPAPAPEGGGSWDDPALRAGLARAFSRLTMTFPSPEAYLDFWFPGQGLTLERLPDDLADYYRYDLARVEEGWRPKASPLAAAEDAAWAGSSSASAERLQRIACPVALAHATEGFAPGAPPVVGTDKLRAITAALRPGADVLLAGANHYSMMFDPYASRVAELLDRTAAEAR
jgi:lipase